MTYNFMKVKLNTNSLSKYTETTSHERTFLIPDRGQASCSQTDQVSAKLPLITDKQEATPTFYAQYGRGRLHIIANHAISGYCKKCYN